MESFVIPKYDSKYPSLGSQVIVWIEDNLVYGLEICGVCLSNWMMKKKRY